MAVERHRGLEAQRVAGAQATRDEAELLPRLAKRTPERDRVCRHAVELVAKLARVAGTRDHAVDAGNLHVTHGRVVALRKPFHIAELGQHVLGERALQRQLGDAVRQVLELRARQQVGLHVGHVLLAVGGIDHDEVLLVTKLVDDEVVDAAAMLVAHDAVAHLAQRHVGVVVGEEVVDGCQRARATEQDLAHVRDVKQADLGAHGLVLGDDARAVLDGQQVPRKRDDLAAFLHMDVVQGGLSLHRTCLLGSCGA